MNISELTTQERSVMLAKLTGRYIPKDPRPHIFSTHAWYFDDGIAPHGEPDLYNERYMALAWLVLNWADKTLNRITYRLPMTYGDAFQLWWEESTVFDMPPAVAQAAWLDKVLQLAIEAGLVQP